VAARLGALAYRHRWPIIAAWLVLFAGTAAVAPRVTSVLKGGGYSIPTSQSDRAYSLLTRTFGYRALAFTVVFHRDGAGIGRAARAAIVFRKRLSRALGRRLQSSGAILSGDRQIVFVRVYTRPRQDFGIPLTRRLRPLVPSGKGFTGYVTGPSAVFYDMERVSDDDLRQMEIVTFPIALIILLIIFGTLVGSVLPVSMGPLTVTAALASIFLLGHVLNMSIFVLNTASMLGLGVAIDYSLFMVQRFREELKRQPTTEAALVRTVETAGMAITVSAITVAIGFLGMTLLRITMLTSLGVGGSVVVGISLLAALTLLPALLGVLGQRVNALAVVPSRLSTGRFWSRLSALVMRRPWPVIGAVLVFVALMASPAHALRVGVPGPSILPKDSPSRVGAELLSRHLGLVSESPVLVTLRSDTGFRSSATRLGLLALAGRICRQAIVAGVSGAPVVNHARQVVGCRRALAFGAARAASLSQRRVALFALYLRADPSSAAAEAFVRYLRGLSPPPDVHVLIGGQTAAQLDFDTFLYDRFPWAILFVVISVFVVLALAFRSLLLPIKAVVMNGLSVLAAWGATVFVFQDGALQQIFGFTVTGSLDSIVPIFVFCVLFGISTDYEVFLLARVREEYRQTGDNTASVSLGLQRTGRMITSAALIMVVVFGAFSFARLVVIKELGFAMAVGVLVDATVIRALLVPAAMRIAGRWNWWPGIRGAVPNMGGFAATSGADLRYETEQVVAAPASGVD